MKLGQVSDIQEDERIIFRATMDRVDESSLYWRGITLNHCDLPCGPGGLEAPECNAAITQGIKHVFEGGDRANPFKLCLSFRRSHG
ncbi:MAG: hypothetical protein A4E42_00967 [Methanoregulaceae archaeon PtaU1.Bin222]|nr:MAG: hypothetical protein A4E42_00967 [Methanoregulaceae archaeon PtaU1.Bin222]